MLEHKLVACKNPDGVLRVLILNRTSTAEHRPRLKDAGLELREEIAADLPATALDSEVLERVLANL